jgi:hypothetical protein
MMAVTVSGLLLAVSDVDTPLASSSVRAQLILCDLSLRDVLEACLCWLLAAAAVAKSGEATTLLHCPESTRGCLRFMAGPTGVC